jgi:hypothetical protein
MDFSMWDYMKNIVHTAIIHDVHDLQDRIYAAVVTITLGMIHHTWDKTKYHMDVCRATSGAHCKTY